jgi:hypothetical protein
VSGARPAGRHALPSGRRSGYGDKAAQGGCPTPERLPPYGVTGAGRLNIRVAVISLRTASPA